AGPAPPSSLPRGLRPEERRPLRDAIHRLLAQLPAGTFFSWDEFFPWAGDPCRNPLLLGRSAREVIVRNDQDLVPPLEDHLDDVARTMLRELLVNRLVGLGCVQMG